MGKELHPALQIKSGNWLTDAQQLRNGPHGVVLRHPDGREIVPADEQFIVLSGDIINWPGSSNGINKTHTAMDPHGTLGPIAGVKIGPPRYRKL